jgi:hypothetical protein
MSFKSNNWLTLFFVDLLGAWYLSLIPQIRQ